MPYSNEKPVARGRPRDPELDDRILTACLNLLSEVGYQHLSFEEVARRAATSKSSLYRRWKTKRDMVLAALRSGPVSTEATSPVDTGSLRGDLLCLCHRLNQTMRSADSQTAMLLLQAGIEDPELCDAIEQSVGPTGARLPHHVIEAAVSRGELSENTAPFAFEETVGAALLLRRTNGLTADDDYLEALIDTIVLPALQASCGTPRPLPAGIFSGHPTPVANATEKPLSNSHPAQGDPT